MADQATPAPAAPLAPGEHTPDPLEKVWAVAGLVAAAVLAFMAWDLLRGPRPPQSEGGGDE